jgi:hypothetical protein
MATIIITIMAMAITVITTMTTIMISRRVGKGAGHTFDWPHPKRAAPCPRVEWNSAGTKDAWANARDLACMWRHLLSAFAHHTASRETLP